MDREELILTLNDALSKIKEIREYNLHGSLITEHYDEFSDVDFKIDVSGTDNGRFMMALPAILNNFIKIGYFAFAPKFVPDLYLITIYFENTSIFHFVDIECLATPHVMNVTKMEILKTKEIENVKLKLLIHCLKNMLRGTSDCFYLDKIYSSINSSTETKTPVDTLLFCFNYFVKNENAVISNVAARAIEIINKRV
ncbi:MAG: hypothetical protein JXB88_26415 [Spirochaetales bacterium]|nr:hypothetical protein [Spirochaetales bacterium]